MPSRLTVGRGFYLGSKKSNVESISTMSKPKKLLKPTVTLVLTIDEPITIKKLSGYLKSFLLSEGPNDWLLEHIKNVRVRSIDFD